MTSTSKTLLMTFILSLGILTGCNMSNDNPNDEDNHEPIEQDDENRQDQENDQTNTDGLDVEDEKGDNLQFDKDRGPD